MKNSPLMPPAGEKLAGRDSKKPKTRNMGFLKKQQSNVKAFLSTVL